MASIYKRARSPYWWIKYKDPGTGKHVAVSSKILLTAPKKQIELRLAKYNMDEKLSARSGNKVGAFDEWVPQFIESHFKGGIETMRITYRHFTRFFKTKDIVYPDQITPGIYDEYLAWRLGDGVCKNTVNKEYVFLKQLMGMSEDAGYVAKNPLRNRRIQYETPKPKTLISDVEIEQIRTAIQNDLARKNWATLDDVAAHAGIPKGKIEKIVYNRINVEKNKLLIAKCNKAIRELNYKPIAIPGCKSEWMARSKFLEASCEIMWLQGLRIGEIYFHLYKDVDLQNNLLKIKAKGDRYYTPPLNPKLRQLILKWRDEKRVMSLPDEYVSSRKRSGAWWHFLRRLKLDHLSSHCFRVTFISRAINAGIPMGKVMRLTNHSREAISLIYQKFDQSQMADVWDRM